MTEAQKTGEAMHAFLHWLETAGPGAERPYDPDTEGALASSAAVQQLVARGWNSRMGAFVVRLSHRLGEGLTP